MLHFPRYTHFLSILITTFLAVKEAGSTEQPHLSEFNPTPILTPQNSTPLQNLPQNQENNTEKNEDIEGEGYYYLDNMGLLKSFLFFIFMDWYFSDK